MRGRRIGVLALLSIICGLMAACGDDDTTSTSASSAPEHGGEVVIARGASIDGWDGNAAFTATTYNTIGFVFGSLLRADPVTNEIEGYLAESFEYTDPQTLELHLHDGLTFSDGSALTSQDVAFSTTVWQDSPNLASFVASLASVDTPDDTTVVLHLSQVDNYLTAALSESTFQVVPTDFGGMTREQFFAHPIGAGPFMIESEQVDEEIVLARNPHYFEEGKPILDRVILRTITDPNQRLLQFQQGQVDILDGVPLDQVPEIDDQTTIIDSSLMFLLGFNWRRSPGDDPTFRKALSLAFDREELVQGVLNGNGEVPGSTLAPASTDQPGPTTGDVAEYDPQEAARLVAESNYDGQELGLLVDGGRGIAVLLAQAIQQELADIGVNARIDQADTSTYIERWSSTNDFDLIVATTYAVSSSPGDTLSYQGFLQWLYMGAPGDEADAAWAEFLTAPDEVGQRAALTHIEDWAYENIPYSPLVLPDLAFALQDDIEGFAMDRNGFYGLEGVSRAG